MRRRLTHGGSPPTRWYEARKYALSVALLPAERYRDAFEPGCSIGVLTELLAPRCDRLLSCDGAAAAVRETAARTAQLPQVRVQRAVIPHDWPPGEFDLIVFSEILYYFAGEDLDRVLRLGVSALRPGGTLLAVHWRHPVADYPRGGDEVHQALASAAAWPGWSITASQTSSPRCTSAVMASRCRWPRPVG